MSERHFIPLEEISQYPNPGSVLGQFIPGSDVVQPHACLPECDGAEDDDAGGRCAGKCAPIITPDGPDREMFECGTCHMPVCVLCGHPVERYGEPCNLTTCGSGY